MFHILNSNNEVPESSDLISINLKKFQIFSDLKVTKWIETAIENNIGSMVFFKYFLWLSASWVISYPLKEPNSSTLVMIVKK